MKVSLERIWTDDDQMLQIAVVISNGEQVGAMEVYLYPEQLKVFGEQLQQFPSSMDHDVELKSGGDGGRWYGDFRLRAFVTQPGEVALEVRMVRHGGPPFCSTSHMYIRTEAANLNRFGGALAAWKPFVEPTFLFPEPTFDSGREWAT